ncbi:MAG TPA: hypothetical protein VD886_12385 [Herpetosiphonaceae bacterium]|nr:hypothetical protein [Herpetosiphonaceae bacterium]
MIRPAPASPIRRRELLLLIGPTLFFVAVYWGYGWLSTGAYNDDDLTHYLIARWSWRHPELLLDVWGRPAWTLLHAPIAPLGFAAARVWSALLAGLVGLLSALLARAYGVRWYWLAIPFVCLQPEWLRQGFSTLTELAFGLALVLAALAYRQRRWTLMALAAGWLPLARYESVLILAMFILVLLRERRWPLVGLALLPLLAWNGYWAAELGTWTRLLFPLDRVLFPAAASASDYGTGPLWYYPSRLPVAFGGLILLLALRGALRLRPDILHGCVLVTVGLLSLGYAFFPDATAIAGYIRHLAMLAPIVGVWAAAGLEALVLPLSGRRGWLIRLALLGAGLSAGGLAAIAWRSRHELYVDSLAALALALLLLVWRPRPRDLPRLAAACVVVAALGVGLRIRPFQLTPVQQAAAAAGRWVAEQPPGSGLLIGTHPWMAYAWGGDVYDPQRYRQINQAVIAGAPAGSLIVWDSHYSDRMIWQVPLSLLRDSPQFALRRDLSGAGFQVYIYEKIAP